MELTSLATVVINLSSWEITITPPFHFCSATISASRPFRWAVSSGNRTWVEHVPQYPSDWLAIQQGISNAPAEARKWCTSSSNNMCGRCNESTEKATRDFWPPLSVPINCSLMISTIVRLRKTYEMTYPVIPLIWKFPRCDLYSCSLRPGNLDAKNWTGVIVGFKESTWCWAK